MTTAESSATLSAHSIDFIDEDDAGGVFFGGGEQITNARSPHADEHLNELTAVHRIERHPCFTGHCARQQGFTCTWRAVQQDPFGHTTTELLEFFRRAQELNDFLEVCFDTLEACDIIKGNMLVARLEPFCG